MTKAHGQPNATLPPLKDSIKGVDRESSTFYFCKGGCNRKYLTANNWMNHMVKEHGLTNIALPPLEKNNTSKGTRRIKPEKIRKQRTKDQNDLVTLQSTLHSMSEQLKEDLRKQLVNIKQRLELTEGESVATGTEDCVICMVSSTTTAIIPCGHTAFCVECADLLQKRKTPCPICRGPIQHVQRLFLTEDCLICMVNSATTAIIPCGHTAFCVECADVLQKKKNLCTICRGPIQHVQILFFS